MPRKKFFFGKDWLFHMGECPNGADPALNDSLWEKVSLPDDFLMRQPWDEKGDPGRGFKPMAEGWYRKRLSFDPAWKGKKILLDIESIMLRGKLYCDGVLAGETSYGYLGFEADLTPFFREKKEILLAIYCTTGKAENSRWYTGCGVRGNIDLVIKPTLSFARYPLYIKTPQVSPEKALIEITAEVEGLQEDIRYSSILNIDTVKYGAKVLPEMELLAEIFSPDGKKVKEVRHPFPEKSRKKVEEVSFPPITLKTPHLWSLETPFLYKVKLSLLLEGKLQDQAEEKFGIRTIQFSREKGFLLNGEKVFLKGSSGHHDFQGAMGANCTKREFERLFDTLKEFGFNHVRCAHNPCPDAFYEAASEKGILVTDELYDGWAKKWAGGEKPWMQLWGENIPQWVKKNRNHPSIILWSLGNEIQMREDRSEFPGNDWCVTGYRVLSALLKRYDTTRPTTIACFPAREGGINRFEPEFHTHIVPPELAQSTEIASFNYLPDSYKKYLEYAPHMIVYQSEANVRHLSLPFVQMDQEKMVGLSYWGAIAYWGESPAYPNKGWYYSFFDHTLEPHPQAYLAKSLFKEEFTLSMGVVDEEDCRDSLEDLLANWKSVTSHWNRKAGKSYHIFIYTNGDEVELFLNGKSLGVKKNDSPIPNLIFQENVPYEKGTLTAAAYRKNGEKKEFSLTTTSSPAKLLLLPEKGPWKGDGKDRKYVRILSIDKEGRRTPSNALVKVEVSGGKLLALDHGDQATDHLFHKGELPLYNGSLLAILQAGEKPGKVLLKVTLPGLPPQELALETEQVICKKY